MAAAVHLITARCQAESNGDTKKISLVTSDDRWKFIIRVFQVLAGQFCHGQFLSGHIVRVTVKPVQWPEHAPYNSFAILNASINNQKPRIDRQHVCEVISLCDSRASTLPVRSIPSTWSLVQGL